VRSLDIDALDAQQAGTAFVIALIPIGIGVFEPLRFDVVVERLVGQVLAIGHGAAVRVCTPERVMV
jgi:hypothetical protein